MNKTELKHQIKDLYNVLNECVEHSPSIVKFVIKMAMASKYIEIKLNARAHMREIKRNKLTNDFIKKHKPFDIHEALNIDIKEAREKLKNFDFTAQEKNIILNKFCSDAESFLTNISNREVSN